MYVCMYVVLCMCVYVCGVMCVCECVCVCVWCNVSVYLLTNVARCVLMGYSGQDLLCLYVYHDLGAGAMCERLVK